ncbi:hypothetical protein KR222_009125, partial [Zaprionus bogoriensis]
IVLAFALAACVAAHPQRAVLPVPAAFAPTGFNNFAAPFIAGPAALAAAPLPLPLAISGSQRLNYFNQFNAAFAPPAARLLATPAALTALPGIYGYPATARFGQLAPGTAPYYV